MNYFSNKPLLTIVIAISISSCGNISSEMENKLNELQNKTESLDSMINKEVDTVKKLDTLINKSSSHIDSIAKKSIKLPY